MSGTCGVKAVRAVFACVLLGGIALGCGKDEGAQNEAPTSPLPTTETSVVQEPQSPPEPIDRSFVPSEALQQLEGMALQSNPPCSDTIDTLTPALESIASNRARLDQATTAADVVQLLTTLSAELDSRLPSIEARSETDELRRISAELTASIGDLAESLKLASDAITAQDRQASGQVLRRIQNGVANARSSIERLIDQCAS
ncbi:MAG: hypothetical protein GY811_11425 [Myxococcales bacterium]|nr:hypothetical protein [Myxococcales bacterium]